MPKTINLINAEVKRTYLYLKFKKKIREIFFVTSFVFALLALATIAALIFENRQIAKNRQRAELLKGQIKSLDKNESYILTILDRAGELEKILANQTDLDALLVDFQTLMVPGFVLKELKIDINNGFSLTGDCENNQALTNFNEKVHLLNQKDAYSKTIYPSVSRGAEGRYSIILEVSL
jgi:hypothetical protein